MSLTYNDGEIVDAMMPEVVMFKNFLYKVSFRNYYFGILLFNFYLEIN